MPITVPHKETFRDILFSIWAIYWLFLCIWKEKIELFDSIGFLGLYALYIITVIIMSVWEKKNNRQRRGTWTVEGKKCLFRHQPACSRNFGGTVNLRVAYLGHDVR